MLLVVAFVLVRATRTNAHLSFSKGAHTKLNRPQLEKGAMDSSIHYLFSKLRCSLNWLLVKGFSSSYYKKETLDLYYGNLLLIKKLP